MENRRAALVVGGLVALLAAPAGAQPEFEPDQVYKVSAEGAPARGAEGAPITVVEFSDFQCRFCVKAQATLADLARLYPGKLRLVYRHNPLDPEDGTLPAEAAEAAAEQGRFWEMHDLLFANPVRLDRAAIEGYALELGLDMAAFRAALDDRRHRDRVLRDARAAAELRVRSTPMFFVNGRPVKGAQPLSVFTQIIDQELEAAGSLRARGVPAGDVYRERTARGLPRARPVGRPPVYQVAELDRGRLYRVAPALPGHSQGPEGAPVTIVAFADFECGFCAAQAPRLMALRDRFAGDVRLELRHLPLAIHPNAQLAAEAAVAAAEQGKLWPLHDLMFAHEGPLSRPVLEALARRAGLEMGAFRAALDQRRHRELVERRAVSARALGISGTPTLFVNGVPVVGAVPEDALGRLVAEKLRQAKGLLDQGVSPAELDRAVLGDGAVVEPLAQED